MQLGSHCSTYSSTNLCVLTGVMELWAGLKGVGIVGRVTDSSRLHWCVSQPVGTWRATSTCPENVYWPMTESIHGGKGHSMLLLWSNPQKNLMRKKGNGCFYYLSKHFIVVPIKESYELWSDEYSWWKRRDHLEGFCLHCLHSALRLNTKGERESLIFAAEIIYRNAAQMQFVC